VSCPVKRVGYAFSVVFIRAFQPSVGFTYRHVGQLHTLPARTFMRARFARLLSLALGAAVLIWTVQTARLLISSEITLHSFEHYLVRLVFIFGSALVSILSVQFLAVRNPAESVGVSPTAAPRFKVSNMAKMITDILVAVVLLTLLSPLLVVISILIFILEGYPVFYISKRYIALDHCVPVLKFRTMAKDATSPKYRLRERFMRDGYLDIPLSCEVYTPLGRVLERTQLVEILQLFNILLHRMSLIGNRPLPLDNINLLKQFPGWERRFNSPAGLTGISQVVGKLNQSPQQRLELECLYSDLYRIKNANIYLCDLYIAYYTVRLLLFGKALPIDDAKRLIEAASGKKPELRVPHI
jgi:lipopolysaccharide/colanic/teichoic acid biosynthesis glycosyltransferase